MTRDRKGNLLLKRKLECKSEEPRVGRIEGEATELEARQVKRVIGVLPLG
jgi:hypothetical protein